MKEEACSAGDDRFSAAPGVNGSVGTCHSEGQHGTISNDDGGTDLCQHTELSCQSKHSSLWDDERKRKKGTNVENSSN